MTELLSFTSLPAEILEAILQHVPPASLISLSQTSKLLREVTDSPIIWRHYCQTTFRYWNPSHNITAKFNGPLSDVDWRAIFVGRVRTNRETNRLLQLVLRGQRRRIRFINDIADLGYDAKETLLKQCDTPDDAEDVLARRYYAKAALERIHRGMAIQIWKDLSNEKEVDVEQALGAYDMFVMRNMYSDLDSIKMHLDTLAADLRGQYPDFHSLSARQKALTLTRYLRGEGFQGASDTSYHALQNNFIGLILTNSDHESLPLISAAIYCAIAQRLGLRARPCGFIFHVYVLVYAPPNTTMNGDYIPGESDPQYMYIDPFRSDIEVPVSTLHTLLRERGIHSTDHSTYLRDASTRELVLRTARNIMHSVQMVRQNQIQPPFWTSASPDMDYAFYSTLWSSLILGPSADDVSSGPLSSVATRRRQYLPYLLEQFQAHFPWDITLIQEHIIPLFFNLNEGQRLIEFINNIYSMDALPKQVKARGEACRNVKYKVGQLFQHKRYSYEGVITGWDICCEAGEEWIRHMGVDRLDRGKDQSFYHVLVYDKSVRYVAEENIQLMEGDFEPSGAILELAGRHFKRWDGENKVFISNIKDEYPDD